MGVETSGIHEPIEEFSRESCEKLREEKLVSHVYDYVVSSEDESGL